MHPDLRRQVTTLSAIVGSIVVNTFSNIFPPNGVNVGTLSNTLFANVQIIPANYAFAIWGLVYIGLIAFGIFQLQSSQRDHPRLQRSGYLLTIACIAQSAWIYLFLARLFILSNIAMFGILLSLIGLYQCLEIGQERVGYSERWSIQIPTSIYLGWISVATIVNVATTLYSSNWDGWGIDPSVWTVVMMVVAATIATVVSLQRRDAAFVLVIVWALVAVAIRQVNTPLIAIAGWAMAIALTALTFVNQLKPLWQSLSPSGSNHDR
jgi:hypothetical protein